MNVNAIHTEKYNVKAANLVFVISTLSAKESCFKRVQLFASSPVRNDVLKKLFVQNAKNDHATSFVTQPEKNWNRIVT